MTSTAASGAPGTSTAAALAGIKRPRSGSGGTTLGGAAAGTGTGTSAAAQPPPAAAAPSTAAARGNSNKKDGKDTAATKGDDGESECTPEGLLMAHALGTLTSRQLGQFEAYRNVTFPADAVAAYVSHRLCHNEERRYVRRHGTAAVLGGGRVGGGGARGGEDSGGVGDTGLGVIAHSGWGEAALRRCPYVDHAESQLASAASTTSASPTTVTATAPPLRDMVAPETEQEVTAVVSALAKLHAQRLVAAARRLATAEGHPLHEPLRPHHVVQAKRYRAEAGLDPGFFMGAGGSGGDGQMGATGAGGGAGGSCGAAAAAALDVVDIHRLKMEAAIEAQREYEARFEGGGDDDNDDEKEEEDKEDGEKATTVKKRKTGEKDDDGDTKMEE